MKQRGAITLLPLNIFLLLSRISSVFISRLDCLEKVQILPYVSQLYILTALTNRINMYFIWQRSNCCLHHRFSSKKIFTDRAMFIMNLSDRIIWRSVLVFLMELKKINMIFVVAFLCKAPVCLQNFETEEECPTTDSLEIKTVQATKFKVQKKCGALFPN